MRREYRKHFPRHRLQRKPLVSDPGMHHRTCDPHVLWCMSGSLTRGVGEHVLGIPGAWATRNFTYLVRGPLSGRWKGCDWWPLKDWQLSQTGKTLVLRNDWSLLSSLLLLLMPWFLSSLLCWSLLSILLTLLVLSLYIYHYLLLLFLLLISSSFILWSLP